MSFNNRWENIDLAEMGKLEMKKVMGDGNLGSTWIKVQLPNMNLFLQLEKRAFGILSVDYFFVELCEKKLSWEQKIIHLII